jgi:hypothetical protein
MKKFLLWIANQEIFWVIMLSVFLYGLAYGPVAYWYQNSPSGRTYLGFNAFAIDWLGQLATAQEGFNGHIFRTPIMSSTMEGKPFLLKTEYLLIGHLARITHISVINALKIAIFLISIFYLICIWIIIRNIFSNRTCRVLAYFLTLYATGISLPAWSFGWVNMPKYSLVFERTTLDAPHYMLSGVFTIVSLYLLSQSLIKFKTGKYILAIISGLLAVQIFFPSMMVSIIALAIFIIIRIIRNQKLFGFSNDLIMISVYSFLVCLPLIQLWYAGQFFDMNTFKQSENIIPGVFDDLWQYFLTVGLILIPSVLAIPYIFKNRHPFFLLSLSWAIAHPVVIFVIRRITYTNKVRFFQTPYFIFFAILGASGIYVIYTWINKKSNRFIALIISLMLIITIILSGKYTYLLSLNFNAPERSDFVNDQGYPGGGEYQAMTWLKDYCSDKRVIMAGETNSTLLLALTPCKVYYSTWVWQGLLYNEGQYLENNILNFYNESLSTDDARNFLINNQIYYIYYGNAEQYFHSLGGKTGELTYQFLQKVYDKRAIIYKIDPSLIGRQSQK